MPTGAASTTSFALKLLDRVGADGVVLSPSSVQMALTALRPGVSGAARAAACVPIMVPPPGRFSITTVAPCILLVHRRADLYPDPAAFRPERFLERPAGTYTWIPFGGGVRRCIGATLALFEMKTVLRVIAGRVDTLAPETEGAEPMGRSAIVTVVPARGGQVIPA